MMLIFYKNGFTNYLMWLKKERKYIYIMEYYSAVKKNSFESVLMRWL